MAYVVLESSVRTHRKMLAAGPAACWLWVCGNCYSQEGLTDGHIPEAAVDFLGVRDALDLAGTLVAVGLWDRVDDGWQVHDYHDHNKSADEVRRIMRARQDGGKLGGRPPKPQETSKDNLQGSKKHNLARNPSGTSGTSVPTVPTDLPVGAVPPAAALPSAPAVLTFAVTGKGAKLWPLTTDYLADLQRDYEHLDVLAECKKASAWLKANPGRTKTAVGMPKFLVNWLNRAAAGGASSQPARPHRPAPQPAYSSDWFEECQRVHGGSCDGQYKHSVRVSREIGDFMSGGKAVPA